MQRTFIFLETSPFKFGYTYWRLIILEFLLELSIISFEAFRIFAFCEFMLTIKS